MVRSLFLLLILPSIAVAQIDPRPDGMSLYFDTEGVSYCEDLPPGVIEVPVYLLLTHPSADRVAAWEARVLVDCPHWYGTWVPIDGQWQMSLEPDWIVVCVPPLEAAGPVVVLMRMDMVLPGSPADPAVFTVMGVPGSLFHPSGRPGYTSAPYVHHACHLIHETPGDPVAWLNSSGDCIDIVGSETLAWGAVKRLW